MNSKEIREKAEITEAENVMKDNNPKIEILRKDSFQKEVTIRGLNEDYTNALSDGEVSGKWAAIYATKVLGKEKNKLNKIKSQLDSLRKDNAKQKKKIDSFKK